MVHMVNISVNIEIVYIVHLPHHFLEDFSVLKIPSKCHQESWNSEEIWLFLFNSEQFQLAWCIQPVPTPTRRHIGHTNWIIQVGIVWGRTWLNKTRCAICTSWLHLHVTGLGWMNANWMHLSKAKSSVLEVDHECRPAPFIGKLRCSPFVSLSGKVLFAVLLTTVDLALNKSFKSTSAEDHVKFNE